MIWDIYVYMCTNFHEDISIFGSSIFWKSMTKLYVHVHVYDDSYSNIPLSFEKWIHRERTHPGDHSPLESQYVKAWKRPFPMFHKLRRKRSEYDSQCFLLHTTAKWTKTKAVNTPHCKPLHWRPWKKLWVRDLTTIRSQMHKSWVWRKWSQVDYLSQVKSKWDQCPASSSPAQISKP